MRSPLSFLKQPDEDCLCLNSYLKIEELASLAKDIIFRTTDLCVEA